MMLEVVQRKVTATRVAASLLILHNLLDQDQIILLNSELANKSSDEQIEVLERWCDMIEGTIKV